MGQSFTATVILSSMRFLILFICFLVSLTEAISSHAVLRNEDPQSRAIFTRTISGASTRTTPTFASRARRVVEQEPALRRAGASRSSSPGELALSRRVKTAAYQNGNSNGFYGKGHLINGNKGYGGDGSGGLAQKFQDALKYPPATATALANDKGLLIMHAKDLPNSGTTKQYNAKDHSEGKSVQGRLAAFAVAASSGSGGQATASGYQMVVARVRNDTGTKGCIECFIPGQLPVKVSLGSGDPVTMTFHNKNPHLGPLEIKASQDGPGSAAAAATNYRSAELFRRYKLDDYEQD